MPACAPPGRDGVPLASPLPNPDHAPKGAEPIFHMPEFVTLVFTGRLVPPSFAEFVRHRAGRLALEHGLGAVEADSAEVMVRGHPDLIDAFEMACSLGPLDCMILACHRAVPGDGAAR